MAGRVTPHPGHAACVPGLSEGALIPLSEGRGTRNAGS